jgi:hypothetical protein
VAAVAVMVAACQTASPLSTPSSHSSSAPVASAAVPSRPDEPSSLPSPSSVWAHATIPNRIASPLSRVTWTGTQFLAAGSGTLFASDDGRTWQQQPQIPDGFVDQVAAGPEGLLAVGQVNAEGVVAIWHSGDGRTWTRTPDAASLHGRDGAFLTMAAIVSTGTGWLAVGAENVNCVPRTCSLVRGVGWTSPDGLVWTRSADGAAVQQADITGVVRTSSGYLAVGAAAADPSRVDSAIRPAAWTSQDGRTWARTEQLPAVDAARGADVMLDAVAVSGGRVVVVGHVGTPDAAHSDAFAWWSNGGAWSSVDIGQSIQTEPVRVVAVPGGLLAILGTGLGTACASALWTSLDGSSWGCLRDDTAFAESTVFDAAVSPEAEVLVGSNDYGALAWVSTPH